MPRTMVHERVGADHLVAVHRPVPIDPEEWAQFLDVAESIARSAGQVRVIVRAEDKGGPDAAQRADLNERFANLKMRSAVLTQSRVIRGVAMALSWFKIVDIKAFAPTDLDKAMAFLDSPEGTRAELVATLRELEKRLAGSGVA